jgi:hypothetical protein
MRARTSFPRVGRGLCGGWVIVALAVASIVLAGVADPVSTIVAVQSRP